MAQDDSDIMTELAAQVAEERALLGSRTLDVRWPSCVNGWQVKVATHVAFADKQTANSGQDRPSRDLGLRPIARDVLEIVHRQVVGHGPARQLRQDGLRELPHP